ncbi:MAG: 50S ribosomal protein L19e [Candidatus Altiarchaeota archaeon]
MTFEGPRRLAGAIMKVGRTRVKFDPARLEEVSEALTKDDIRSLIKSGAIKKDPKRGISRGRARARKKQKLKGRSKGMGRRGGTAKARTPEKKKWMNKIRAIREELRMMREKKEITPTEYRKFYLQAKGNLFQSRRHLREQIGRVK